MNRYINIKDEWDIVYCSETKGHTYICVCTEADVYTRKKGRHLMFLMLDLMSWNELLADDFTSFVRDKKGFFRIFCMYV